MQVDTQVEPEDNQSVVVDPPVEDEPTEDNDDIQPPNGESTEGEASESDAEPPGNGEAAKDEQAAAPDDEGELVVTIGDEDEPSQGSPGEAGWVTGLRRQNRELKKEIQQYRQRVEQFEQSQQVAQPLGAKPTLEGCDYDAEAFEQKLDDWHQAKRRQEAQAEQVRASQAEQERQWQQTVTAYAESKNKLSAKDFEEAEEMVTASLNDVQRALILQGADDAARVVYGLGKNPQTLEGLSKINDPAKFAFAVAKLETQMKFNKRKPKTTPSAPVSGSAPKTGVAKDQLEILREKAERTGDYSEVFAYKRKMRAKG